jgi:AraC-like DNA-binding protein
MYREIAPPPDMAAHVACLWVSEASGGAVLPDGCADVVWTGAGLVVAGPATEAVAAHIAPGTAVFGVRFRLGAAGPALGLPAAELADLTVPLAEVWDAGVEQRVAAGGLPALVQAVRVRLRAAERVDPLARAAALGLAAPGARVAALGDALGISERQLRRRFADAVGYGPKTLARVLRFQRFLALAAGEARAGRDVAAAGDGERRPDLAGLAFAAGYADQAHLTRECRQLAGRTPAALLAAGAGPAGEPLTVKGSDPLTRRAS